MKDRLSLRLLSWTLAPALLLSCALAMPSPAGAQEATAQPAERAALQIETRAERLDGLFSELRRTSDQRAARRVVDRILAEWADSGSATVDLLMQWAESAIDEERHGTALDLLDQVTTLMPDYAEGWNRRAGLHYRMDDHRKAMADINRVLSLEPRHIGALADMARIMSDAGNDRLALQAYMRSLEVYPADRATQRKVGEIEDRLSGSRI